MTTPAAYAYCTNAHYRRCLGFMKSWLPSIVGIVIGSFFTLTGVFLTNRANQKILQTQLEHDRAQKSMERVQTMRRDVYLGVAEAIEAALSTVSRFTDLTLEPSQLMSDYRSKNSQIAKIHIVATEPTVIPFLAFTRELHRAFLGLSIKRRELLEIRAKMTSLAEQMRNHQAGRDGCLERIRRFNEEGSLDKRRLDILESQFEFEQQGATKAASAHNELLDILGPRHLKFAEQCHAEELRLTRLLLPVLEGIRVELEQPINIEFYSKVLFDRTITSRADLEKLFGIGESRDKD